LWEGCLVGVRVKCCYVVVVVVEQINATQGSEMGGLLNFLALSFDRCERCTFERAIDTELSYKGWKFPLIISRGHVAITGESGAGKPIAGKNVTQNRESGYTYLRFLESIRRAQG